MSVITTATLLRQLKADLIGKDSYRGVTLTYAWLANQLGHFSLGFIPTLVIYTLLRNYSAAKNPALLAAIIVAGTWFLFELYNFFGPLLLKKKSGSKRVYTPGKKYEFQPSWLNVAFDTATDICYFALGAFSCHLVLSPSWPHAAIVAGILLLLCYPAYFWFTTRIYLQTAQYPLQFRLSQWEGSISDTDKKVVLDFISNKEGGNHLFIFGPKKSGKTSMAIGIATELSNKHVSCSYTTAMKLYSMFFEDGVQPDLLWDWRSSAVMVIDDINPGDPITDDLVTAPTFLRFIDRMSDQPIPENRDTLKHKNIIWVMGNKAETGVRRNEWESMLKGIGIEGKNIFSINLL
jgi:hypothetical protein